MPRMHTRLAALGTALAVVLITTPVDATSPAFLPVAALTSVSALGVTTGETPAYVTTPSGLFRSTDPTYSRWEQMNHVKGVTLISPNPRVPGALVYATDHGIFRSLDGGRTATQTSGCALNGLVRAPSAPDVLYAATGAYKDCPFITKLYQAILRSVDDGRTWAIAYRPNSMPYQGSTFGPVAVDPINPGHVVAGIYIYLGSASTQTIQTFGTGKLWTEGQYEPLDHAAPRAIAFDPVRRNNLWIAWSAGCPGELDLNGKAMADDLLTSQDPVGLAFDPLSGRLYTSTEKCQGSGYAPQTQIYTVDGITDTYLPLTKSVPRPIWCSACLAITSNGYLLAGGSQAPLTVLKLNGPGIWGRAAFLSSSARLLGSPISPPTVCHGSPCQYFEKGALLKGGAPVPLVAGLLAAPAAASLPVGGTTSTVTYGSLAKLASRRVPPPAGFRHGVLVGAAGTFVPLSARLSAAPGEIVPSVFWRFLTTSSAVPGGWLHDIGLPLTPAVPATVTKGALGKRAITIQAFQYAILTDDPRNPPATQVERANIGSDYAAVFPAATR